VNLATANFGTILQKLTLDSGMNRLHMCEQS